MRLNVLAAAAALTLACTALSACSTAGQSPQLLAAKADLGVDSVADLAYKGVDTWFNTAKPSAAQAAAVRKVLDQARQAQLAADTAYLLADGTAAQKVQAFEALLIQLAGLTGQPLPDFSGVNPPAG